MMGESSKASSENMLFWFVAVPNSSMGPRDLEQMEGKVGPHCAFLKRFNMPNLKVGTLDSLYALSDELAKRDTFIEATTRKIARQLYDLYLEDEVNKKDKHEKILMVNGVNVDTYLHQFKWDEAKYKLSSPLKDIVDAISTTVSKLDEDLRTKASNYNNINQSLAAIERKKTGNLLICDLTDFIKPEDIVETEYLTTLFVIVPKHSQKEWLNTYETLVDNVVPRSSNLLHTDGELCLYTVVLFRKIVDDFKHVARLSKFTVREFTYDPEQVAQGKQEEKEQHSQKEKQKKNLIRWCRLNFAEAFSSWTHLKVVRIFVESVLRYGLPVDFTCVLLEPLRNHQKKIRTILEQMFAGVGSAYFKSSGEDDATLLATGTTTEKFYPYVFSKMHLNLSH
ncbi:V-type proton ATPase subunit C [Balamuthia mandrillaris]